MSHIQPLVRVIAPCDQSVRNLKARDHLRANMKANMTIKLLVLRSFMCLQQETLLVWLNIRESSVHKAVVHPPPCLCLLCLRVTSASWAGWSCREASACGSAIREQRSEWRRWPGSSQCRDISSCTTAPCSSANGEMKTIPTGRRSTASNPASEYSLNTKVSFVEATCSTKRRVRWELVNKSVSADEHSGSHRERERRCEEIRTVVQRQRSCLHGSGTWFAVHRVFVLLSM